MKANTTLTTLDLHSDDKIEKRKRNKNKEWNRNEMIINTTMKMKIMKMIEKTSITNENEQITVLENQEQKQ